MDDRTTLMTPDLDPELIARQLAALDAYHAGRRVREAALESAAATRELRLEASRRLDAIRREHAAILARAEQALRDTEAALRAAAPRVVLAHRQEWMRTRLAEAFVAQGAQVLAVVDDGADASAAVVFEQPDLVLVEDRLPSLAGIEVVERAREYAPHAVVGVQLLDDREAHLFVDAGAVVLSRRLPPAEVAQRLAAQRWAQTEGDLSLV